MPGGKLDLNKISKYVGKCKRYISIFKILFKDNLLFITNIVRFIAYIEAKKYGSNNSNNKEEIEL